MSFLEYASRFSIQKDKRKLKILIDDKITYPTLIHGKCASTLTIPEPRLDEEAIGYIGYNFSLDDAGKIKIGRLVRAIMAHISAHTVNIEPALLKSSSIPAKFAETLCKDIVNDAFFEITYPTKLVDLAYANALAINSFKPLNRIYFQSTRLMAGILKRVYSGVSAEKLEDEETAFVEEVADRLKRMKLDLYVSISDGKLDVDNLEENVIWLREQLARWGPFVEMPSFPHTENASRSGVLLSMSPPSDEELEPFFVRSLKALGRTPPAGMVMSSSWVKSDDVSVLQAFGNQAYKRNREAKILTKLKESLQGTCFKSIEFPQEDYSGYLITKELSGSSSVRLLESIILTSNFESEDIRKKYGVLDLSEAIQVIANDSKRSDIFLRDELLKKSFALAILLDVSSSMEINAEENRARALSLYEAARNFITNPSQCVIFGFSDRLFILKDRSEAFTKTVRSRIGGIPFGGTTYMPDAVKVAAETLKGNFEEQKLIIVLSDGSPYGYEGISNLLEETNKLYERQGIILIGLGFNTEKMGNYFKNSAAIYNQMDMITKVSNVFINASSVELQ
jgi:hypothetical protein